MSGNSWLHRQRKNDLFDLARKVDLQNLDEYSTKVELQSALDAHLSDNSSRFISDPDLTGYFNSRSRTLGSPVKREPLTRDADDKALKAVRRRVTSKLSEEISPERSDGAEPEELEPEAEPEAELEAEAPALATTSSALIETPSRALSHVKANIPLPATPADVALAVDRSAVAVRRRMSVIYQDSGITEAKNATRATLSTVTSVLFLVAGFELLCLQRELLPKIYAFTIPANPTFGTPDWPVYVTDMFLLLTSSFWSPALTWIFTSMVVPVTIGYFFNLSATSTPSGPRTRSRSQVVEYVVDPLTFSIAKAVISFVVYGQNVTFNGLFSEASIARLDSAIYGGYKGILTGAAITGLVSIYDAVLRK